jgi:hypothetical protein
VAAEVVTENVVLCLSWARSLPLLVTNDEFVRVFPPRRLKLLIRAVTGPVDGEAGAMLVEFPATVPLGEMPSRVPSSKLLVDE